MTTEARTTELSPPLSFEAAGGAPDGADVLGVPVFDDLTTPPGAGATPDAAHLRRCGFDGEPGDALAVPDGDRVVVALGVGAAGRVDARALRRAAAALARHAGRAGTVATTLTAAAPAGLAPARAAAAVVEGAGLGAYRFEDGRRRLRPRHLRRVVLVGADRADVAAAAVRVEATATARDWINTPARDMTPTRLAEVATELAGRHGVAVEVWDERRIAAEGLGGLGGVAAGSATPPRLIRIEHRPAAPEGHVALVGKGITFDSGGLSLKTASGMEWMKSDMGGAAAVLNAVVAAARLGLPVTATGWVAATENMPSGTAIHPGDVLTARNGTTIEVLNTDAEGRLVLADALSLAAEEEPDAIVDVATLTGAQVVALGHGVAAVMATDDRLADAVAAAGEAAGEPAWRLPLPAEYRKLLDSTVADLRNISTRSGAAGSIIAGMFLAEFVGEVPWAHLDIAGPSWSDADEGHLTKGGTGWATRTLIELLAAWGAGDRSGRAPSPA